MIKETTFNGVGAVKTPSHFNLTARIDGLNGIATFTFVFKQQYPFQDKLSSEEKSHHPPLPCWDSTESLRSPFDNLISKIPTISSLELFSLSS